MVQIVTFIFFIVFPFFVLGLLGVNWGYKMAASLAIVMVVIGLGAILALLIAAVSEPSSYWRSYKMPALWSSQYMSSLSVTDDGFYKYFALPYLFASDLVRLYVHFSLNHGSLKIWIPELISIVICANMLREIWLNPFGDE
jgi:hypothetical protein